MGARRGWRVVPVATVVLVGACGSSGAGAARVPAGPPTWTGCGTADAPNHVVHRFNRAAGSVGTELIPAGTTALLCGNSGYGYRHILRRHQGDWSHEPDAHGDWTAAADSAVVAALASPQRVAYRAENDSFCYAHAIAAGQDVAIVVVRHSDGAIITAYPGTHLCTD